MVTAEDGDAAWDKNATIIVLRNPESIHDAVDVHIDSQIRVFFTKGGENACKMYDVVHLICFNNLAIPSSVTNIKFLVPTRKVKLLVA